jgi:hypothetical protein
VFLALLCCSLTFSSFQQAAGEIFFILTGLLCCQGSKRRRPSTALLEQGFGVRSQFTSMGGKRHLSWANGPEEKTTQSHHH